MTKKYPPDIMDFTSLLREWMALESTSKIKTGDDLQRLWELEQEINKRAPREDFE